MMAGSLNHIIDNDGSFTMDLIENMGDAHEALEECFRIIVELSKGKRKLISKACRQACVVDPFVGRYGDPPAAAPHYTNDWPCKDQGEVMNKPQPNISAENIKDEKVRAIVLAARRLAIESDLCSEDDDSADGEALESAILEVERLTHEYILDQSGGKEKS